MFWLMWITLIGYIWIKIEIITNWRWDISWNWLNWNHSSCICWNLGWWILSWMWITLFGYIWIRVKNTSNWKWSIPWKYLCCSTSGWRDREFIRFNQQRNRTQHNIIFWILNCDAHKFNPDNSIRTIRIEVVLSGILPDIWIYILLKWKKREEDCVHATQNMWSQLNWIESKFQHLICFLSNVDEVFRFTRLHPLDWEGGQSGA
jgi:hypothetical protein